MRISLGLEYMHMNKVVHGDLRGVSSYVQYMEQATKYPTIRLMF
jgi:hypothetical protein